MRGDRAGRAGSRGRPEAAEATLTIPFLTAVRGGETSIEVEREDGRENAGRQDPPGRRHRRQAPPQGPGRARPEGARRAT